MTPIPEPLPDPKAIALISKIAQLMDEVELVLCGESNQQGETIRGRSPLANGRSQAHAGKIFAQIGSKIVSGAHRTNEIIHAHPYRSLAIALGTGALLGLALARRTDDPV